MAVITQRHDGLEYPPSSGEPVPFSLPPSCHRLVQGGNAQVILRYEQIKGPYTLMEEKPMKAPSRLETSEVKPATSKCDVGLEEKNVRLQRHDHRCQREWRCTTAAA